MATSSSAKEIASTTPAAAAAKSRAILAPVTAEPTACSAAPMATTKAISIWPTKTVITCN